MSNPTFKVLNIFTSHSHTMKNKLSLWLLVGCAALLLPAGSPAQVVIGSWQDNDGNGWIDWGNQLSIADAANAGKYSFVPGAVAGYGQSLQIGHSGVNQNLAIKLQDVPGGVAAFLTNHLLTFTYSVPPAGAATAGYSQLYELAVNASGYGFVSQGYANLSATGDTEDNQGNQPNFYFYSGAPARSQVVTLNYSNILSAITATPESGYIELIFSFNTGGGAPTNFFVNNVVLSGGGGEPPPPLPPSSFTFTLLAGPVGAALDLTNGVFTWRPSVSQANTTNLVTVKVTDNGTPPQSATNSFTVFVNPLLPATISAFAVGGGLGAMMVEGTEGPDYTVWTSTNLVTWQPLLTTNSPSMPLSLVFPVASTNQAEFYQVELWP